MSTWRDATPDDLLSLWRQRIGPGDHFRDRAAMKALLERLPPTTAAWLIMQYGPDAASAWAILNWADEAPADRIEAEYDLWSCLEWPLQPPGEVQLAYLTYRDLREGLGVPAAHLAQRFERAKKTLEDWLDGYFTRTLSTPSRTEPAERRAPRRKQALSPADFGYSE